VFRSNSLSRHSPKTFEGESKTAPEGSCIEKPAHVGWLKRADESYCMKVSEARPTSKNIPCSISIWCACRHWRCIGLDSIWRFHKPGRILYLNLQRLGITVYVLLYARELCCGCTQAAIARGHIQYRQVVIALAMFKNSFLQLLLSLV
jgi:hypothetical protein